MLEAHSAAAGTRLLQHAETDIISHWSVDDQREIRKIITSAVLATDITHHSKILSDFQKVASSGGEDEQTDEGRLTVIKTAIKVADISNPSRMWPG